MTFTNVAQGPFRHSRDGERQTAFPGIAARAVHGEDVEEDGRNVTRVEAVLADRLQEG
jgi:hypothetical protein